MTPLRQRMLQDMGIRNLATNTQLAYVQQIGAFARHFDCSPEALGPEQVRAYQVHLIEDRKLAAGSLSVVAAALRFLYKITLRRPWDVVVIPGPPQRDLVEEAQRRGDHAQGAGGELAFLDQMDLVGADLLGAECFG